MLRAFRHRYAARARQLALEAGAPRIGDLAPDFALSDAGGGPAIRLSGFRDQRPVALIFGSFT